MIYAGLLNNLPFDVFLQTAMFYNLSEIFQAFFDYSLTIYFAIFAPNKWSLAVCIVHGSSVSMRLLPEKKSRGTPVTLVVWDF